MFKPSSIILLLILLAHGLVSAQPEKGKVIDKIVGVVGNNLILKSDIDNELQQYSAMGNEENEGTRCFVYEELLFQKLLVHQAEIDSVTVSDAQVNGELDNRMRYYVAQAGSEQKLEEFMGKSIAQMKEEYREDLRRVLLAKTMQGKITGDLKITPAEVRAFFNSIPTDSLPFIDSEVELCHIVKKAPENLEEKHIVKEKMEKLRERVVNGEDFATLAVLYSEDGSAPKGGELGFKTRAEFVSEFSAAAFALKGKEVSPVIESQFGYHIVQLIERRGEQANVRHILMQPKVSNADLAKASAKLDSIRNEILSGAITFEAAAAKYSDDEETKNNRGNMVNMATGTTRFEVDELEPGMFFVVDKMKVGDISNPVKFVTNDGKPAYHIILLKHRTEPHRANMKEDYQRIQTVALAQKQNKVLDNWVRKKKNTTYLRIDEDYQDCKFRYNWLQKETSLKEK
jgi:peptidyl-prolyl cis-trans isomerase SurA